MSITNLKAFSENLGALLGFYNRQISDPVLRWWFEAVDESLSDADFDRACFKCMKTQRYLPPINEFIELVTPSQESIQAYEDGTKWGAIVHHSQRLHPAIAQQNKKGRQRFLGDLLPEYKYALQRLGGMQALHELSERDLYWREKDFMEYVKMYRLQQQAGNVPDSHQELKGQPDYVPQLPEPRSQPVNFSDQVPRECQPQSVNNNQNGFSKIGDLLN